jgi:DNA topoisomerase-3
LTVYETVKDKRIANAALTGNWENALTKMTAGTTTPAVFRQAIEIYTREITGELLATKVEVIDKNAPLCPKCKKANIRMYPKVAKCSNKDCGLLVFRQKNEKQLTDKQTLDLLNKGKTSLIKGFKSKAGKSFEAALKFDEAFRVVFEFPEKK